MGLLMKTYEILVLCWVVLLFMALFTAAYGQWNNAGIAASGVLLLGLTLLVWDLVKWISRKVSRRGRRKMPRM